MKDGYWIVRTYEAGPIGEKIKYWVPHKRPERNLRREQTEIKKQDQNEHSAIKRLARLLNENYGPAHELVGLDYSEEGMRRLLEESKSEREGLGEEEQMDCLRRTAERRLRLVIRCVKRDARMEGKELKIVAVTSDMDGETGEHVRVHHHLVISREAREVFADKWAAFGGVNWKNLRREDDYLQLAEYLMEQVRRIPDAKKYISSRNLVRPRPKDRAAQSDAMLRMPKGGKLLHVGDYKPGQPQYIRYVLPGAERSDLGGRKTDKVLIPGTEKTVRRRE